MTNFLEELYYGNIDSQARGYRKGSHNLKVSKDINELEEKYRHHLLAEAQRHIAQGLLTLTDNHLSLSRKGLYVSDMVMSDLMM